LAADLIEATDQLGERTLSLGELAGDPPVLLLGFFDVTSRVAELLFQVAGAMAHGGHVLAVLSEFFFQIAATVELVLDHRLVARNPLAVGADYPFGSADFFVDAPGSRLGFEELSLGRFGLGNRRVSLAAQRVDLILETGQRFRQASPIDQGDLSAKLL